MTLINIIYNLLFLIMVISTDVGKNDNEKKNLVRAIPSSWGTLYLKFSILNLDAIWFLLSCLMEQSDSVPLFSCQCYIQRWTINVEWTNWEKIPVRIKLFEKKERKKKNYATMIRMFREPLTDEQIVERKKKEQKIELLLCTF